MIEQIFALLLISAMPIFQPTLKMESVKAVTLLQPYFLMLDGKQPKKKVSLKKSAVKSPLQSLVGQIVVHLKYFEKFQRICPDQMHVLPAVCYSENREQIDDKIGPGGIGICQVNKIHAWRAGSGSLLDPETNIRVACEIIHEQGGNPWTDFRNGNFMKYIISQ